MNSLLKKIVILAIVLIAGAGVMLGMRGQPDSTTAQGAKRVVTDSLARQVEIPTKPRRVVILNASHLDVFCAAGGADIVVGKPTSKALSDKVIAATANAKEIGVIHSPDVEAILNLQPDLIIGINVPFHQQLIPIMQKAGVPVLIESLDTYEQVQRMLSFYGELTGKADVAEKSLAEIDKQYQQGLALAKGKSAPKNLIVWGTTDSFSMATSTSFIGNLVFRLGGGNIADAAESAAQNSGFIPLSMEFIAERNPEVIFIVTHGGAEMTQEKVLANLDKNNVWNGIAAVKNNRVYLLPYQIFAVNPGTRVGEALAVVAGHMYPSEGTK